MYIFFFKQKTAYEMRISDWSSDVCSSDLISRSASGSCASNSLTADTAGLISVLVMAGLLGDVEHHQPAMTASLLQRFCRTSRTLPISIWFPYQEIGGSIAGECSGRLLPPLHPAHIYPRRWIATGRGGWRR